MKKPWYDFLYVNSAISKLLIGIVALLASLALLVVQWRFEAPRMQAQTDSWEGRGVEKGAEIFSNNCASCHGPDGKGIPSVAPALHSRYFFENRVKDVGYAGSLEDYIKGTVAAGRPSNAISQWSQRMPTWGQEYGGPLRTDQVQAVTDFVLNWEEDALVQTEESDPWIPFENAPTTGMTYTVASGPVEGEVRPPDELFVSMGCQGCHNLNEDQTPTNRGPVAPHLGNLDERAGATVAGEDAATYVYNSIAQPNAYVVEGYPSGIMPQQFATTMSEEEITNLSQWILEQAAAN
jgi:mono/diheme cytochrome c family protein